MSQATFRFRIVAPDNSRFAPDTWAKAVGSIAPLMTPAGTERPCRILRVLMDDELTAATIEAEILTDEEVADALAEQASKADHPSSQGPADGAPSGGGLAVVRDGRRPSGRSAPAAPPLDGGGGGEPA